ncbi:aspartate/glutamate racemase family protein [Psychrobacter sp. HD31]|uniref:aspartate/glutamate racemase family protein n=1 Tax=Psychrobacter sp. HD31 TaxID=3112003 RepID=UPI003DA49AEE
MKTIGILGGMSYESTANYYTLINKKVNERLGKNHSAKLLIASVDFEEVVQQQKSGDWQASSNLLAQQAKNLQSSGAEAVLLSTNTMHKVADGIQNAIDVPFLHIVDCMADELLANGIETVGLLGTAFTMQDGFYHQVLENRGIKVVTPDLEIQPEIHRIIFDELCHGTVLDTSCDVYIQAIEQLKDNQAQAVILGCTEIGLMIHQDNSPLPVFDSTLVHVEKAVEWILGE